MLCESPVEQQEARMAVRGVGMTVEEEFRIAGETIYAGRYAGEEISRKSVNHAGGMLTTYQMQYGSSENQNGAIVAVVKTMDVTDLVESGKIKLDD